MPLMLVVNVTRMVCGMTHISFDLQISYARQLGHHEHVTWRPDTTFYDPLIIYRAAISKGTWNVNLSVSGSYNA
jgi:hypothetical protein